MVTRRVLLSFSVPVLSLLSFGKVVAQSCNPGVRANVSGCNFDGADLSGLNMTSMNASNASFVGADLTNSNLTRVNVSNADFTDADLSGATITGTNFVPAILCNTTMPSGMVRNDDC